MKRLINVASKPFSSSKQSQYFDNDKNEWIFEYRDTYTYNEQDYIEKIIKYYWDIDNATWQGEEKVEITYIEDEELYEEIEIIYLFDVELIHSIKNLKSYSPSPIGKCWSFTLLKFPSEI